MGKRGEIHGFSTRRHLPPFDPLGIRGPTEVCSSPKFPDEPEKWLLYGCISVGESSEFSYTSSPSTLRYSAS